MTEQFSTAAEVREGDIILSPRHGYRRFEVGAIEVQTERLASGFNFAECDQRVFTWRPAGHTGKFYRGDCFEATDGILVEKA